MSEPSPTSPSGSGAELTPVAALQAVLAGEHAATWIFGVLAAQSSQSEEPVTYRLLDRGYGTHRAARDQLTVLVAARGEDPVAAEAAYELPASLGATPGEVALVAAGLEVEQRLTRLYGQAVASTSGSDRRWAIRALADGALRELTLGGTPATFPGLD